MNVLFYPSWYQSDKKHNNGIFFKTQAEAIAKYCHHFVVMLVTNIQWKQDKYGLPKWSVSKRKKNDIEVWEYTLVLPNIFKRVKMQEFIQMKMLEIAVLKMKHRCGKVDVIHAQSFLKAGYDGCRVGKKYKIPVVTTEHLSSVANGLSEHAKQRFLYTMRVSNRVISVSNFLDAIVAEYLPESKSCVIPNPVSTEFFYDSRIEKSNVFTYISVGHLIAGKRTDNLIEGFAKAFSENENVRLLIVGDGNQRLELEAQVQRLGRVNQIRFMGALTHDEVCELMKKSHVLVHTSRLETFGVVLVEALSSGLPIICTRCGGPDDILCNYGCTAIGVDKMEELTAAMKKIRYDYYDYDFEKISKDAICRFGEKAVAEEINSVYESVSK